MLLTSARLSKMCALNASFLTGSRSRRRRKRHAPRRIEPSRTAKIPSPMYVLPSAYAKRRTFIDIIFLLLCASPPSLMLTLCLHVFSLLMSSMTWPTFRRRRVGRRRRRIARHALAVLLVSTLDARMFIYHHRFRIIIYYVSSYLFLFA